MAKKVVVELIDDTDSSPAAETVSFALDGVSYEIDLSDENAAGLRSALAPWISAGRRVSGARRTAARASKGGSDASAIRAWARAKGIEVSERGRIPADLRAQYAAEN
ncbi:Lsr2 protein [Ruaniaceae bacterium KH17]|nr:Lsr2 protein [Ruaniaceae bacterium KH17]